MADAHVYRSRLRWQGSTGDGYDAYDRAHTVAVPPAEETLELSSDAAFRGDPRLANPEQLLLAAASSCQLLAFLAIAARSRVEVRSYADEAEAVMPADSRPMRITRIVLRPRVGVGPGVDHDRVARMLDRAHESCYIANTLAAEVVLEPVIEVVDDVAR